ncbi:MAG: FN3 associated domain-containing protein [Eubacterium sp.]
MQGVKRALDYGYSLWEMGIYEAATVDKHHIFSIPAQEHTMEGTECITLASNTKGVEIRYTTDGSTPNEKSNLYVPSIKISKKTTIKAIAYRKGMIDSPVSTGRHTRLTGGINRHLMQPAYT